VHPYYICPASAAEAEKLRAGIKDNYSEFILVQPITTLPDDV